MQLKKTAFLTLLSTLSCLVVCTKNKAAIFWDPPPGMPPIPVFWFYDKQNLEVWTVMGPDSRYHPKGCYKDNITGDLNAASDFDYLIERRSLKNDKKQLRRFGGTLGSITKPITKKDHHAALDLRYFRKGKGMRPM